MASLDKTADLAGPGIGDYAELEQVLPDDYTPLLTPNETQRALAAVKRHIEDGLCRELGLIRVEVPLIVGSGTNDTRHAGELTARAAGAGMDGVLVVTPYYSKPTQEGVLAHFRAVADTAELPVMLYDIPGRSSITISDETYAQICTHPNVVAVKDAVGDLARGVRLMQETGLAFYSGDDVLNLGWLTHGAAGVVSVVGHIAGQRYADMTAAVQRGDLTTALDIYRDLGPLVEVVMTRAQGAMTAKAAMQIFGVLDNRNVRLPLVPASDELVADLRTVMTDLGFLTGAEAHT